MAYAIGYCRSVHRETAGRTKIQFWSSNAFGAFPGDRAKADYLVVEVEHQNYPGWAFRLVFDGEGGVVDFRMHSAEEFHKTGFGHDEDHRPLPEGGLTARTLHSVPLGELVLAVRTDLATKREESGRDDEHEERWWAAFDARPRPGRRGRGDPDYAGLAAAYVRALTTTNPIRVLAKEAGMSPTQARGLVYEARRRGLLTPAPSGKAGGQLTDKALGLLRHGEGSK